MYYIQRNGQGTLETVDETETRVEAKRLMLEYQRGDPTARYYTSKRPCKNWTERD